MGGRHRWAITAVAVAIVVIAAAFIATRPNEIRDPPVSAFVSKNVAEDSVELTLTITPSTRTSYLSVMLIDESTGSSARAGLNSTGSLQLADGGSFLLTYGDLNGDGLVGNGDTVQITGPFTSGSYSVALLFDPAGITLCRTTFAVG